jgi:hypothetical protein
VNRWGSARAVHLVDASLIVWIAAWIWLGIAIGHEVSSLTSLSDTVVTAGRSVQVTGQALQKLEGLPFGVGERIAGVHEQLDAAGASAVASGEQSRGNVEDLAVLLTIAIAVIPSVPVLALYVPFRISRILDVRTIRRAARRAGSDPAFEEFLARRAAENLPYHRLREVTHNPWRDLEEGRFRALAKAELARLGLSRLGEHLPGPDRPSDPTKQPRAVTG